jgi:hypothetical protein
MQILGYFIIDKLQTGVRFGYEDYKFKNGGNKDADRYWVKYGAYTRYYFLKPEKLVNFTLMANIFLETMLIQAVSLKIVRMVILLV